MANQDTVSTPPVASGTASPSQSPISANILGVQIALDLRALKWLMAFLIGILAVVVLLSLLTKDFKFYFFCVTGDLGYCEVTKNEAHDYISAMITSDIKALKAYVENCKACQFKDQAQEKIHEIEGQRAAEKEQFNGSTTLAGALEYIRGCQICDFKEKAIALIEGLSQPKELTTAALDTAVKDIVQKAIVPNGTYAAERGFIERARPSPTQACQAKYRVPNVSVRDGAITFSSDGKTWSGTIDQQTGMISINGEGITPRTGTMTYIRGNYRQARAYDSHCGRGFFRIVS
jgi:hypothetical protein